MDDSPFIVDHLLSSSLPVIEFGRDVCGTALAHEKEWLITNGLGGYASATISGALCRRYHGLLIAALEPPLKRTLLLAKIDETIQVDEKSIPLYSNIWRGEMISPNGNIYLESFRIFGSTPVWSYRYENIQLEKAVLMAPRENTVLVTYDYVDGSGSIKLILDILINNRGHHIAKQRPDIQFQSQHNDGTIYIDDRQGVEFRLQMGNVHTQPVNRWVKDLFYPVEAFRGLEALDDQFHIASVEYEIQPGSSIQIVGTAGPPGIRNPSEILHNRINHEKQVIDQGKKYNQLPKVRPQQHIIQNPYDHLLLAADQFIVQRSISKNEEGLTVIAGYPWFSDWGRDTMISLVGLTLVTGRHSIAKQILRTFASYINEGMLPNRFPSAGATPEYNTVDATLWFFQAIYHYYRSVHDDAIIDEFFPTLEQIINWHILGTRHQIKMDKDDGLLFAGEPGVQLTWMDAKIDHWVVTPRIGKPIEINALWYNALLIMVEFAGLTGKKQSQYENYAKLAHSNFWKFWNKELGYCYDVIDGPAGNDQSLRPNQIFAVSLAFSPLSASQQKMVVDCVEQKLLTPFGLRSLSPDDPQYIGVYGGNPRQRDAAYHQGTVWGWLIGPFISAFLKVYQDPDRAINYIAPLIRQLYDHGVGSLSEIFEGDPPHLPRGCIAQAWSVAEVLRAWHEISLRSREIIIGDAA